jgi:large subunit ribosomal protein L9
MAIKLLLIEDIEELGRSGDIVSVRPGYARNFLLPKKFAIVANKNALRMQARLQEERSKKAILEKEESEKIAKSLENVVISTTVKVDHEGNMYGSVSATDIVHLLQEQTGILVEKRSIVLKQSVKVTGAHEINIKLKEGVKSLITLKVEPEEIVGGGTAQPKEESVS